MIRIKVLCNCCNKEISASNIARHIPACEQKAAMPPKGKNLRNTGKPGKNQFTKAARLGLPKPEVTQNTRDRISSTNTGRKATDETKKNIAAGMKAAVLANPDSYSASNVCGRVKVEEYKGSKFHGKWEVEVAKWFDENNVVWQREVAPISYFWNNGWHLYFPDFYLPEKNVFVEVKGYETERDRCKWAAVPNLVVIKQQQIYEMRNKEFKGV